MEFIPIPSEQKFPDSQTALLELKTLKLVGLCPSDCGRSDPWQRSIYDVRLKAKQQWMFRKITDHFRKLYGTHPDFIAVPGNFHIDAPSRQNELRPKFFNQRIALSCLQRLPFLLPDLPEKCFSLEPWPSWGFAHFQGGSPLSPWSKIASSDTWVANFRLPD